ncbi:MAG: nitrogen fixation protein FixH [Pseudomonadota bacterium]|nr:nitrogen fixation protein FixH [Pseudomonadota bacterium]
MWMVVGGPAIVIVAGFITLYLAISRPDPVYTDAPRANAAAMQPAADADGALMPAVQARNHAATGGVPRPAAGASAPSAN